MRWVLLFFFVILGLVMLVCGLLIPVHLRAADENVIEKAGRGTRTMIEEGLALTGEDNFGAAQLVEQVAREQGLPESGRLSQALMAFFRSHPATLAWGCVDSRLDSVFGKQSNQATNAPPPFTEFVAEREHREHALEYLRGSPRPVVQELLKCRALTNTVLFPPSLSAAGQAMDSAIAIAGLLVAGDRLTPALRESIDAFAAQANRGGDSERLEQILMDFLSLGQRLNWGQLVAFVSYVQEPETLRRLTLLARQADAEMPVLFCAVRLSARPASVVRYLMTSGQSGLKDLRGAFRFGAGGLNELLDRHQRLYRPQWRQRIVQYEPFRAFYLFVLDYCLRHPWLALVLKGLCYLADGFCIIAALHFAKDVPRLEEPFVDHGLRVGRQILFALGFLLVVLLASEPFLSQASQKVDLPFRVHLPMVGSAVRAGKPIVSPAYMNYANLLIMLLFFLLQGLLYVACVTKLAEVRRQRAEPQIKLKLLENEDHLFDAGLYLGFLGTIVSFILYSLAVVHQFSLMVAYSSTAFGIVFVSFFKICHLRPLRRRLLLEANATSMSS
jgi:hypothetical protein